MMKKLRASESLKKALGGVPSTEVLNATLTAYRYLGTSLLDMLQNIPLTGERGAVRENATWLGS